MSGYSQQWHVVRRWAEKLNSNAEWLKALYQTLDDIGFSEDYVTAAKQAAVGARTKAIKDSVWGMIELTPAIAMLLDSPVMQRLRFVRQLGFSYLTYPNANHSRFEHSLGTYWVVRQLLDSSQRLPNLESEGAQKNGKVVAVPLNQASQTLVSMAALLHDIGHGPYSHALESLVDREAVRWRVGPFSAKEFRAQMADAQLEQASGTQRPKAVATKSFCELFAAAVIISPRFREFYAGLPKSSGATTSAEDDVVSLASLLLGSPVETNQPALANLISGPIDADKLDYMVRDAQACGISVSLDISRVLFRAGFYQLSEPSLHPNAANLNFDNGPVTVFVIEQSGTDALRELALSRLSLYARVYYHQCTRNAEKLFSRAIRQWGGATSNPPNFLDVWKLGDEELLGELRRTDASKSAAQAIWGRRLPKRAVALTPDCYLQRNPPLSSAHLSEVKTARKEAIDKADQLLDKWFSTDEDSSTWRTEIESEVDKLIALLGLNLGAYKGEWHTVPVPVHSDPTTTAVCLSDDRAVQVAEPHLPQFVKSGEFPIARRYLFCPAAHRDLFSIALQRVAFRYTFPFSVVLEDKGYEGHFRPVIDLERSNQICKSKRSEFEKRQIDLALKGYYNEAPMLLRYEASGSQIGEIATRFQPFVGGLGWRVTTDHIKKFIEQFPPSLRDEALDWLGGLTMEDWPGFAGKAAQGIDKVQSALGASTCWIVPLSFTSGTQICKALEERYAGSKTVRVNQDLRAAVQSMGEDDGIIFVDDNIASGTQAEVAINKLLGQPTTREESSTYGTELDSSTMEKLKARKVGFVFSWGKVEGLNRLEQAANAGGLQASLAAMSVVEIIGAVPPVQMSNDLRNFLRRVGRQLVAYGEKKKKSSEADAYAKGDQRALGYGNAEGRLVGTYGVPTSTYTALFCPGRISLTKDQPWSEEDFEFVWIPLFLRSQKASATVFA